MRSKKNLQKEFEEKIQLTNLEVLIRNELLGIPENIQPKSNCINIEKTIEYWGYYHQAKIAIIQFKKNFEKK